MNLLDQTYSIGTDTIDTIPIQVPYYDTATIAVYVNTILQTAGTDYTVQIVEQRDNYNRKSNIVFTAALTKDDSVRITVDTQEQVTFNATTVTMQAVANNMNEVGRIVDDQLSNIVNDDKGQVTELVFDWSTIGANTTLYSDDFILIETTGTPSTFQVRHGFQPNFDGSLYLRKGIILELMTRLIGSGTSSPDIDDTNCHWVFVSMYCDNGVMYEIDYVFRNDAGSEDTMMRVRKICPLVQ